MFSRSNLYLGRSAQYRIFEVSRCKYRQWWWKGTLGEKHENVSEFSISFSSLTIWKGHKPRANRIPNIGTSKGMNRLTFPGSVFEEIKVSAASCVVVKKYVRSSVAYSCQCWLKRTIAGRIILVSRFLPPNGCIYIADICILNIIINTEDTGNMFSFYHVLPRTVRHNCGTWGTRDWWEVGPLLLE